MDFHDDEILDVVPLSVIPCEALDLNHPMDASASACPNQGNISSIPSSSTHATSYKEDIHHIDRVIRNLVTRILNEGHSVKGVSTPLSKMYPSSEVAQHSEKNNDSSSSEKDMVAEGMCSLGQTVSGKGKYVASKTANASHSEKHDVANDVIDLEDDRSGEQEDSLLHHLKPSIAGVGPSKSWSKVEVNKRKVREVSESEEDVEEDVPDISPVKKTTVRKSPMKVVVVHLDNISFHLEDGAAKWKFCYKGLVKEFIVNIPEDIADKNSKEFCKVLVRGRRVEGAGELEATDNEVCREITSRQVKGWPIKNHLPAGKLTVKFMFEQIIKHASTNAVKLLIAFPSMICGIILNQHPGILSSNDLPSRRKHALSVHYKLFEGSHVEDIVMASAMKKPTSKFRTIAELKETCKELGEGIRIATARKDSLEALIASLERAESCLQLNMYYLVL
ncbi:uncharacterized protein LOC127122649 [Lathyrus oleraceus]|uniref:uncharacterized protein LOC127122649 n=1 Tax=Pisum sativum TaxID=3888 RepID=UPI0021CF7680|nr:uncharacterized protein LOC127122649 [Pisum sativum]